MRQSIDGASIVGTTGRAAASRLWPMRMSRRMLIGAVGVAPAVLVVVVALVGSDWDPAVFLRAAVSGDLTDHLRQLLGDIPTTRAAGHDGKWFFLHADDPFLRNVDEWGRFLDTVPYRTQRMLYPTLAAPFGLFGPRAIAWAMVLNNLAAVVVGTLIVASAAHGRGLSAWLGVAFGWNLGVVATVLLDGADVVAWVCIAGAIVATQDGRVSKASGWLAAAALARETAVLAALALLVWHRWSTGRWRWRLIGVPAGAMGLWFVYVFWRSGERYTAPPGSIVAPLSGFDAGLSGGSLDRLTIVMIVFGLLLVLLRSVRTPGAWSWVALLYGLMALVLGGRVLGAWFDSSRTVLPLLTVMWLAFAGIDEDLDGQEASSRTIGDGDDGLAEPSP